jgi:hypothetical protein
MVRTIVVIYTVTRQNFDLSYARDQQQQPATWDISLASNGIVLYTDCLLP